MTNETIDFAGLFTSLGEGLGNFLNAIAEPVLYIVVVLGVAGAVVGLIYGVTDLIRRGMHKGGRK